MTFSIEAPSAQMLDVIERWHRFMRTEGSDALDDLIAALTTVHELMGLELAALEARHETTL
jgi:hypothetical protein